MLLSSVRLSEQIRERNSHGPDGSRGRCLLCNRPVNNGNLSVELDWSTGELIRPGDPKSGGETSQGLFPVGPECAKRVKGYVHA